MAAGGNKFPCTNAGEGKRKERGGENGTPRIRGIPTGVAPFEPSLERSGYRFICKEGGKRGEGRWGKKGGGGSLKICRPKAGKRVFFSGS